METSQEHSKERNNPLTDIAAKYGPVLRDRIGKLKQWGVTSEEAKEIYKEAIQSLHALGKRSSPHDKAAAIEKSILRVLGPTKYDVVTAQARLGQKIRFRIAETVKLPKRK